MKLEVGMYVRTKNGIIDKVIIDYKGKCNSPNCNCKHVSCQYNYYDEVDIINASHNIIDLIEVGDYVNGYRIDYIENTNANNNFILQRIFCEEYEKDLYSKSFKPSDIKSIVTKEQMEQMAYKVGD